MVKITFLHTGSSTQEAPLPTPISHVEKNSSDSRIRKKIDRMDRKLKNDLFHYNTKLVSEKKKFLDGLSW